MKSAKTIKALCLAVVAFIVMISADVNVIAADTNDQDYLRVSEVASKTQNVYDGDSVILYAVIRNSGDSDAVNPTVSFTADGRLIDTVNYNGTIAAHGQAIVAAKKQWNAFFGSHKVSASVIRNDSQEKISMLAQRIKVIDDVNPETPTTEPTETTAYATEVNINKTPKTYCNPINLAYQYQSGYYSREGADPAVITYKNEYYLFVSHNSAYWWSDDLANWNFVYSDMPEIDKFAPAVCVVGDTLYLTHSNSGSIYKTTDPKSGKWDYVSHPMDWDDPALFIDDDGRVYCYYGCSDSKPIQVVELDPNDDMKVINGPKTCIESNPLSHGFEVPGDNNTAYSNSCWIEGSWMTKYNGKYYLSYAAPGTEYAAYADGCYVADSPMGEFEYCENSPISYKSSGNAVGAGHGSLLKDLNGNWWKFDTVSISVNHSFERRINMMPATFDKYGQLVVNTVLSDYPTYITAKGIDNYSNPRPDWNLISYNAKATASSSIENHTPELSTDESLRTWWSATTANSGEWLQLDLGKVCKMNALQLSFADQDVTDTHGRDNSFCYNYVVEFSVDGDKWYTLADHTGYSGKPNTATDTSNDYYELTAAIDLRYVRVTNKGDIPANGKFAISSLRLFGNGNGKSPDASSGLQVTRPQSDERSAVLTWNKVDNAQGYIVRYGCKKDSLNISYQVVGNVNTLTVNNLNMGTDYWFTVDSYNDSGYAQGTMTVETVATVEPQKPLKPGDFIVDGYDVYEAENATLGGGATADYDGNASGEKAVHNMHFNGAYFELSNVNGGNGGNATIRLVFANGNAYAKTQLTVNGKLIGTYNLDSSGAWNQFTYIDIPVSGLLSGNSNTIRFVGGDQGFNADFVQVIYGKN